LQVLGRQRVTKACRTEKTWDTTAVFAGSARCDRRQSIAMSDYDDNNEYGHPPEWLFDPCPDGDEQRLCHILGFRERNIGELELRVVLGDGDNGVCQLIVHERDDEVWVPTSTTSRGPIMAVARLTVAPRDRRRIGHLDACEEASRCATL
jgi:hypothetical protein